jgi:hypothetical protein
MTAPSTNVAGKSVICLQKTETRSMPVTIFYVNLKWIKDLNIRRETFNLVQERGLPGSNRYRQGLPQ